MRRKVSRGAVHGLSMEIGDPLEDESDPARGLRVLCLVFFGACALFFARVIWGGGAAAAEVEAQDSAGGVAEVYSAVPLSDFFPVYVLAGVVCLIAFSAFFSASEVAFFSLHRLRLRGLGETGGRTGRLVSSMMERPGHLLTTILVGNMIVNVLISVVLPGRVQSVLELSLGMPVPVAYLATVLLCTGFLVYFGEVTPKVVAVRVGELFARSASVPLKFFDWFLGPLCWLLIQFTNFIFRVTRLNDIKAAPFITDDEFKSLLVHGEEHGVIEEDEGQMIQGILEFSDASLREILVPRPDVVALSEEAPVREALALFREREFSRMPLYKEDLDHITGILFAKDLLPTVLKGEQDMPVREVARAAHFVPETMTVAAFVRDAQRFRTHLAIVVDEFGGTEGIVTLEEAIEEVVGDIQEEDKEEKARYDVLGNGSYRVEGNLHRGRNSNRNRNRRPHTRRPRLPRRTIPIPHPTILMGDHRRRLRTRRRPLHNRPARTPRRSRTHRK